MLLNMSNILMPGNTLATSTRYLDDARLIKQFKVLVELVYIGLINRPEFDDFSKDNHNFAMLSKHNRFVVKPEMLAFANDSIFKLMMLEDYAHKINKELEFRDLYKYPLYSTRSLFIRVGNCFDKYALFLDCDYHIPFLGIAQKELYRDTRNADITNTITAYKHHMIELWKEDIARVEQYNKDFALYSKNKKGLKPRKKRLPAWTGRNCPAWAKSELKELLNHAN